jgi:hypothetical protein
MALVVAALWPRPVLLADCDPAGGDVAIRLPGRDGGRLDPERGLVSLAAVGRHGLRPHHIHEHVQTLSGGLDVLAGVATPEQAQAMTPLWRDLGSCLDAMRGTDVIADGGRLSPDGSGLVSTLPLLRASRLVVLLCRPDLSSVVHLRERLGVLTTLLRPADVDGVPIGVVVVAPVGENRAVDGVREVVQRDHPEVRVAGQLAHDPKAAAFFCGAPSGRIDRSLLIRSGRLLSGRMAEALAPFWIPDIPLPSPGGLPVRTALADVRQAPPGIAGPAAPAPPFAPAPPVTPGGQVAVGPPWLRPVAATAPDGRSPDPRLRPARFDNPPGPAVRAPAPDPAHWPPPATTPPAAAAPPPPPWPAQAPDPFGRVRPVPARRNDDRPASTEDPRPAADGEETR